MSLEPPPLKTPLIGDVLERTPIGRWLQILWQHVTASNRPLSKSASYSILSTDSPFVRFIGSTTGQVLTLPSATGSGRLVTIRNASTVAVTISRAGGDVIDDGAPAVPVVSFSLASGATARIIDSAAGLWETL